MTRALIYIESLAIYLAANKHRVWLAIHNVNHTQSERLYILLECSDIDWTATSCNKHLRYRNRRLMIFSAEREKESWAITQTMTTIHCVAKWITDSATAAAAAAAAAATAAAAAAADFLAV